MDTRELAWAAGLFEGEGCFGVNLSRTRNNRPQALATLTMTDEEPVRRFAEAVGVGTVRVGQPPSARKRLYQWQTGSLEGFQHAACVLWFGLGPRRRARAAEILRLVVAGRSEPHKPRKRPTHCKHGHEFTPENTYTWVRDGSRACRECTRGRRTARAA